MGDITLAARTAALAPFNLAFWDVAGDGSIIVPKHTLTDTTGARIDPATKQGIAAIVTALGTLPAQDASVQAITTALGQTIGVIIKQGGSPLSSSNRLPIEIDADNVNLAVTTQAGLAQDASLTALSTALGTIADAASVSGNGTLIALIKQLRALLGGSVNAGGGINVLGRTSGVAMVPAVTASSAYAAGNVVGGLLTFANALDAAQSGILQSLNVYCKSIQTAGLKFYPFGSNPAASTFTDKTAPSIAPADVARLLGPPIALSSPDSGLGTHTVWGLDGISKSLVAGAQVVYGVLVTTGTPTFGSTSDITVVPNFLKD